MTQNIKLATAKTEFHIASRGIRRPRVTTLSAGEMLFRFASTKDPRSGKEIGSQFWARGAWWFHETEYRKIINSFQKGKLALGTVARSAGAVQPSWSMMNVSIKAQLIEDVEVYVGQGTTQYRDRLPNGMTITLSGWPSVEQIYVPNIRGEAFKAFRIKRQKVVSTDRWGFGA